MALSAFEIPLQATNQRFSISLDGVVYVMSVVYRDDVEGGWVLDIYDANENPLVLGLMLVTGADLLGQYRYLGFAGSLIVRNDDGSEEAPTFSNLGNLSRLYWVPDEQAV